MESAVQRVPVEIWRKILYLATTSPLLPFMEDGELSSSLLPNLNLFSTHCKVFRRYRDETQATIERLRSVCHMWSELLCGRSSEFAFTDFWGHHLPSKNAMQRAVRVDYMGVFICECYPQPRESCVYHQMHTRLGRESPVDTDSSVNGLPPSTRILCWRPSRYSGANTFLSPLKNLAALCLRGYLLPGHNSLEHMYTLIPNLSHLQLDVVYHNLDLFTNPIRFPNIKYLYLRMKISSGLEPSYLAQIACPSLRSLRILGWLSFGFEIHLLDFITRHKKTIRELDMADFACEDSENGDFLVRTSAALWMTCPGIATLGMNMNRLFFIEIDDPWHPRSANSLPMTLLMSGRQPKLEDLPGIVPPIKRVQELLNSEKVIFTGSWNKTCQVPPADASLGTESLKVRCEECLEILRETNLLITDRFGLSLVDAIRGMLSAL